MFFDKLFKTKKSAGPSSPLNREEELPVENVTPVNAKKNESVGRNAPCPCGSGKKYKKCCLKKDSNISNPMIGYVAVNIKAGNVFCSGPDCVVAGSKEALKRYLVEYLPGEKTTIQEAYFKQMQTALSMGGTYVLDKEAYARWTEVATQNSLPGATITPSEQKKPSNTKGMFAPPGGCYRLVG